MKTTHKIFVLLFAASTALVVQAQVPAAAAPAASAASAAAYRYKTPELHRAQIEALLARPDGVVFLDVRRPDELSSIGGFPAYLSIQSRDLDKLWAYVPRDRDIVTVSNHAARAGAAADLLAAKGLRVVGAVGVQSYEAEGGTLVKVTAPPPRVR